MLQSTVWRLTGSSPTIQNRCDSRLTMGKTKRVVSVESISPTTETFMKLIMLSQPGWSTLELKRWMLRK